MSFYGAEPHRYAGCDNEEAQQHQQRANYLWDTGDRYGAESEVRKARRCCSEPWSNHKKQGRTYKVARKPW